MLDENTQELGVFSQKNPLKFGFLKQKAKDLGLSTQDFIEQFADKIMKQEQQPSQPQPNSDIAEIKDLLKEQTKAIMALAQRQVAPAPQQTNPFGMIKDFTEALKSLRSYENEVITGFKTLQQEIAENLPTDEVLEQNPEDAIAHELLKTLFANQKAGAVSPQTTPIAKLTAPFIVPNSPEVKQEQPKMNTEEIVKATPEAYKQLIKDGKITLEQAKAEVKKQEFPLTEQEVEAAFNKIREEK